MRVTAVVVTLLMFAASSLIGAAAAQALPKGAYWYTLLDLQKAWKISEGAGVTVAVVDDGVQADLGDLRGQVLSGYDVTGQNPGAQHEQPVTRASQFGHGSDMAALIAGTGKGAGLVGVAPKAKILPVDASSSTKFTDANIAKGITWAVDHGAKIVNVSLGGPGACTAVLAPALQHAYQRDVLVVVSAGDEGGSVDAPANCPGALAISGVDAAIKPWTKSASGPETDFAAPAYGLINELLNNTLDGPSAVDSGTSESAAMVSGTFALLWSKFPHDTARQIVTRALYNVHNGVGDSAFGSRVNDNLGYGMILPRYALTDAPPADAKNPIFDEWARDLAPSTGSASASTPAGTSASTSAGSSSTFPTDGTAPQASSTPVASGGSGGGISPVLILIVIVVIAAIVAVVVLVRHGRAPRSPSGYGSSGFRP